jgi:hypothetical protein
MSRRTVTVIQCDGCGADELAEPVSVTVVVGWVPCPAGGSSERDAVTVDLCHRCATASLQDALKVADHDKAREWVRKVKAGRMAAKR